MRAVSARANVGGVEGAWANEKTLPCRGSILNFTTSLLRAVGTPCPFDGNRQSGAEVTSAEPARSQLREVEPRGINNFEDFPQV